MNRKERRRQEKAAAKAGRPIPVGRQPVDDAVIALMQTAVVHHRAGRLAEAATLYHQILSAEPDFTDAEHLLGVVALQSGRLNEAETRIRAAIDRQPGDGEYWNNLGVALKRMGRFDTALGAYAEAVTLAPKSSDYWINFTDCARSVSVDAFDQKLHDIVLACFSRHDIDHRSLTALATSLMRCAPSTSVLFDPRALQAAIDRWDRLGSAPAFVSNPLLSMFLRQTIVAHPVFEDALTRLRTHLLGLAMATLDGSKSSADTAAFAVALAIQCFSNEYVFAVDPEEQKQVKALGEQLVGGAASNPRERFRIAVFACYAPLHLLPTMAGLSGVKTSNRGPFSELLLRLIDEPAQEKRLRDSVPVLSAITNHVSHAVQDQYEENPYPRWRSFDRLAAQPLGQTIKRLFPHVDVSVGDVETGSSTQPDILIAGCGTGRQALASALRYAECKCLAIDLSRSSLAYAIHMADSAGVTNIEFAQADILTLGDLDRRFDLVECGGVLHHLDDPLVGWRVLRGLLKLKSWMKIGLYSELARHAHAAAQQFVREHGYEATAPGIRSARRDILSLSPDHPIHTITGRANFYTLSECRDLIFHAQERRFTLPEIATALDDLDLEFIGFEFLDSFHQQRYRERFPQDHEARSLENWHQFEVDNPTTFLGMYQFWVRARS